MMKTFMKRPSAVRALQWTGENNVELTEAARAEGLHCGWNSEGQFWIHTPTQTYTLSVGDWAVFGEPGDVYPVVEERFARLFSEVEDDEFE